MENFNRDPDSHFNRMLMALAAGKIIAFRSRPKDVPADDAIVRAVRGSADSLFVLDDRLNQLTHTPTMPPSEIIRVREDANAAFVGTQIKLAAAKSATAAARAALAADEESFYLPSPATETIDVLRDVELRAVFAACDASEKDQHWTTMANGGLPELLAALARFPFGAVAARARTVYKALQEEVQPGRVAAFERDHERLSWATTTLDVLTGALDAGSNLTGPSLAVALH